MLLNLYKDKLKKRHVQRFHFLAAWVTEEAFTDVIKNSWSKEDSWPVAISNLTNSIQDWNKNVFGNINRRKRHLINRLCGIDRANPRGNNTFLNNLQEVLWRKYKKTLLQEEILWCQRARYKWLQFGDRNTKFFHASTLIRRKRDKMEALKDDDRGWVTDEENLKHKVAHYFRTLYSNDDMNEIIPFPLRGIFPNIHMDKLRSIESDITTEEIKEAIFSMGTLKAPGPDDFHAIFFQSQWNVVGESVCRFIKECFQDPSKLDAINNTDVILIPKVDNPDSVKQFRPIAQCNVVYKAITKVIAN